MTQSSKRAISIILSLAFFVMAIFIYASFVVPAYADANLLRGELSTKQSALSEQRQIVEKIRELLARFESIPGLESTLSNVVPNDEAVSALFNEVYSIASRSGLRVDDFSSNTALALAPNRDSNSAALRNLGTMQVETTLIGSYESIRAFIEALERDVRIMDINEVSIESAADPGSNLFTVRLQLKAYYQTK